MPTRPCLDCGALTVNASRCQRCASRREQARDAARGGTTARGYGATHQAARAAWAPHVAAGRVNCARCDGPIRPGQAWDLGHPDGESVGGPEHANGCNRAAAGRRSPRFFEPGDHR